MRTSLSSSSREALDGDNNRDLEPGDAEKRVDVNSRGKSIYSQLSVSYEANERDATTERSRFWTDLSSAWRVMLLSDGSVTRHLSLLDFDEGDEGEAVKGDFSTRTRANDDRAQKTEVEVISMKRCERGCGEPEDVVKIRGPLVEREVFLYKREVLLVGGGSTSDEEVDDSDSDEDRIKIAMDEENRKKKVVPLVYACSWWNAAAADRFMKNREETMWSNLRTQNVELYREVRRVYLGKNKELAKKFGCEDPENAEIWGRHYIFWSGGEPITVVYEAFSPKIKLR